MKGHSELPFLANYFCIFCWLFCASCAIQPDDSIGGSKVEESNSCVNVELESVYENPQFFLDNIVCVDGRVVKGYFALSYGILPLSYEFQKRYDVLMSIVVPPELEQTVYSYQLEQGDLISVSGTVGYDSDCWQITKSKKNSDTELICVPAKPLSLYLISINSVAK